MNQAAERIESLKAGLAGAAGATIVFSGLWLSSVGVMLPGLTSDLWRQAIINVETGLQIGFASFSGFLFGVTYRYIVRRDQNPHLRSGAALAFGLVRGFAQIDQTLTRDPLWISGIKVLESLLLFGILALLLDWLLRQGWLKAFDAASEN